MTEHELSSWLENAIAFSTPLQNLVKADMAVRAGGDPQDSPLDDTFGWGARFENMKKNKALEFPMGLLLTGPSGCGKHTAAAHMLRILRSTHHLLHLNGRELCAEGYETATQRLSYALEHPTNAAPWLLVLENMEACECRPDLLNWLGLVMDAYWLAYAGQPSLFVILIDSRVEDIPSVLRRHLRLCRMSLPTASQRRAYFEKKQFPMIQYAVSLKLLVQSTEGLTYAQLVDLAQNLECSLYCLPSDQASFSDEELLEFLRQQKPAPSLDNPLQSLAQSARQFMQQLPDLLARMGTNTAPSPAPTVSTPSTESVPNPAPQKSKAEMRKELENAPVKEVSNDLMGEDRIAELRAIHEARQRA